MKYKQQQFFCVGDKHIIAMIEFKKNKPLYCTIYFSLMV